MKNNNPPFVITGRMLAAAADIAEQVGRLSVADPLAANPTLRRSNRIRTIHGSLAIEQNTLSLEQVTAVLGGKHVLAPPKDIAEVKNAYEIYDRLDELDPYAVDDPPGAEKTELRARRWRLIAAHLQTHDTIRNADVQALCGVSPATANRILAGFTAEEKLQKLRVNGRWAYRRADS